MNLIELLSSVSKIAIGAFAITLIVVGYEVILLMKRKKDQQAPVEQNITLPDFDKNLVQEGTFSPIAVDASATQPISIQSRKVSRPFLILLLGLAALIILISGFLIYKRSQVSQQKGDEISPISGKGTTTPMPSSSSSLPTGTAGGPTGGVSTTPEPTLVPKSTIVVQISPTVTSTVTGSATVTGSTSTTISPSVTLPTGPVTSQTNQTTTVTTNPTSGLPQAGSYQATLIISVVAIAIIYLALIL